MPNAKEIIFNQLLSRIIKEMSPLCKREIIELTERFELMVCGKEVVCLLELNDPIDQRER
jgi:lysyl-tRNA synthetase class 2